MTQQQKLIWNAGMYTGKYAFVYEYGNSLIELLKPQKGERILDVGCGTGQLTAKIGELCKEAVGIDASAEMIEKAKLLFPDTVFEVADAANFKFNVPFDAVFSNAALHWVKDYKGAIRCMHNCLKQGGRLVLEMGGKGNVKHITDTLREVLTINGYTENASFEQWFFPSISNYTTALEEAGFEVSLAHLYDRPTLLADEKTGILDWLTMFGETYFENIPKEKALEIKEEVQSFLKPVLFKEGNWYADYRRLRIVAYKR